MTFPISPYGKIWIYSNCSTPGSKLLYPPQALGREAMKMLLDKAVVGNGSDFTGSAFGRKSTRNVENHSIASTQNIKKKWTEVLPKLCALYRSQCNIKCLI